jgi:hypothetical protein
MEQSALSNQHSAKPVADNSLQDRSMGVLRKDQRRDFFFFAEGRALVLLAPET